MGTPLLYFFRLLTKPTELLISLTIGLVSNAWVKLTIFSNCFTIELILCVKSPIELISVSRLFTVLFNFSFSSSFFS